MVLNFSKTFAVVPDVMVNFRPIEKVSDFKYLGTIFSSNLKWWNNTEAVFKKLKSRFYALSKFRSCNPSYHQVQNFIKTLILPVLTYNCEIWFYSCTAAERSRLVRLFMKFDGHFMRQGVKFLATSHYRTFNHIMTPEMIDWYTGYSHQVENLKLNEFRNMLTYKNLTNWTPQYWREWEIERLYMETQGNYNAFHDTYWNYSNLHGPYEQV